MSRSRRSPKQIDKPLQTEPEELLPIQLALLNEMNRKLSLRKDGVMQEVTLESALVNKLLQTALSGSPHAIGQVMRYTQRAQRIEAKRVAKEVADGRSVLEYARRQHAEWIAEGKNPIMFFLHPEDIIVTEGVGWKIIGPTNTAGLNALLQLRDERDLFIAQAYLEQRLATKEEWRLADTDIRMRPDAACWEMANLLDTMLPQRFRLDDFHLFRFDLKYRKMTKRELLVYVGKEWRKVGKPVPRGTRMLPYTKVAKIVEGFLGLGRDLKEASKIGRDMSEEEIAERLIGFIGK